MQTYSQFQPTAFDPKGLNLDDQQDWLVVPVMQTRDSGPLDLSNFAAALDMLGGEGVNVEVHRFGHWGPGWFEIIIVRPNTAEAATAEEIESTLEDISVLDEMDYSRRTWNDYGDDWNSYGYKDFVRKLVKDFELGYSTTNFLEEVDIYMLREFFESGVRSGEYYIGQSDGVSINMRSFDCTRDELAAFLKSVRRRVQQSA